MSVDPALMTAMLVMVSDWCVEHRLGDGKLVGSPEENVCDSIFINGNLSRVLICTYELTGEKTYLDEAVRWCDYFACAAANPVKTSQGNDALWWWDVGNFNLYLADTGTAIHALFKAYPYVDPQRQVIYLDALKKFYLLICEGTDCDPMGRGQSPSPGWVIKHGPDAGALAVGYRNGKLDQEPYTISTATAGAQACALLYRLTGQEKYRVTARNAAMWLLGQINERGTLPYRIHGKVEASYLFQGIHYALEGLLTSWLYLNDEAYTKGLLAAAPRICAFALQEQNADGYWGAERQYDGQRSAFLAHFLYWYNQHVKHDERAAEGADRFAAYVLDPKNTGRYGVLNLVRVSGFVGLVFAGRLYPELDLCHPEGKTPLGTHDISSLRKIAERWHDTCYSAHETTTRLD